MEEENRPVGGVIPTISVERSAGASSFEAAAPCGLASHAKTEILANLPGIQSNPNLLVRPESLDSKEVPASQTLLLHW